MQVLLTIVHLLIIFFLIIFILLQRSDGSSLVTGSSNNNFMTGRGKANFLTKTTSILGILFFITSISLFMLPKYTSSYNKNIFENNQSNINIPSINKNADSKNNPVSVPIEPNVK